MGLLIEGVWHDKGYDTEKHGGRFVRWDSAFRERVAPGGDFPPEAGRYHLYVSYACPWAHRTMIVRALKGLENAITLSPVHWLMAENGWQFTSDYPDPVKGARFLYEVYTHAKPDYSGRVTVPTLWDRKTGRIVNNESSELVRILNNGFNDFAERPKLDFYPEPLRAEIDAVNERVYDRVNNGVYKAGFATRQEAYEEAVTDLFATLDWLEERLSRQRYLAGKYLTEADIRLFTTLIRFDAVYAGHFKCNLRRIVDYPNLWAFTREIYQLPGVKETTRFDHIKRHYYESHHFINPTGIVPKGPILDLEAPHGREALGGPGGLEAIRRAA